MDKARSSLSLAALRRMEVEWEAMGNGFCNVKDKWNSSENGGQRVGDFVG